jgi:hypothetical protein
VSLKDAFGLLDRAPERSIWFVAETDTDVAAAHRLATDIGDKHGRLALYISGPDAPSPLTLQPRPIRLKLALKLALSQLRCRAVVLPARPSKFSTALASAAAAKGLPVLFLPRLNINFIIFNSQLPHLLRENPRNKTVKPWSQDIAKRLNPPIASLDALQTALGSPKTVLCLGSGPSSNEDAAVDAVEAADVIFRVKHRWLKEGRIRQADVVFSGTVESARHVPNAILLSQDATTAYRVAWSGLLRGRRIRYGIVEALAPGFHARDKSGARMTNGAAMLALAVALKPERLIIAGIDLYSHPSGAYPGTPETANAYAPAHDRELERTHTLAMLRQQVAQSGTQSLTVIGPLHDIAIQAGIALNTGGNGNTETAP